MDFTDQVAIVTGGASGMGAATARELRSAGAHVIVVDRDATLATKVTDKIGAGPPIIGDVSDSQFCNRAVESTLAEYGRLDIVINAAGIILRADACGTSDEQWERIMHVNVNGLFFMSRAAVVAMKHRGQGTIVNFGSIWGDLGSKNVLAYCASKGAVHQITRAMALDHVKDGIRINAVCPGEVNTPMLQSERSEPITEEFLQKLCATVPMGRLAQPVEIARVVLFLASSAASYMTGALVTVDAGYSVQ